MEKPKGTFWPNQYIKVSCELSFMIVLLYLTVFLKTKVSVLGLDVGGIYSSILREQRAVGTG